MLIKYVSGVTIAFIALIYFASLAKDLYEGKFEESIAELIMFLLLGIIAVSCFSF